MLTHGGADFFLVAKFLKAIANQDPTLVLTGIKDSLRSHKLVFAAEKSRLNSTIETVEIWIRKIEINNAEFNQLNGGTPIHYAAFIKSSFILSHNSNKSHCLKIIKKCHF